MRDRGGARTRLGMVAPAGDTPGQDAQVVQVVVALHA